MFFRFAAGLILVVLISMVGIGLEKQTLEMKRAVSRQYFQIDLLLEMHARLRLSVQKLTAPAQLERMAHQSLPTRTERSTVRPVIPNSDQPKSHPARLPLLKWERPATKSRH